MNADLTRPIDSLRLHHDSERVPVPDHGDLRALRESLRENGQEDPIDITPDGVILDGRTRWTLLRDLGAETVGVRVVDMPEGQQVGYMIDRARARRHLTTHQKRWLSDWMSEQVVDMDTHPKTGEQRRIGMGQSQRAEMLGVDRMSVRRWDKDQGVTNVTPSAIPTHYRTSEGKVQPLHPDRKPGASPRAAVPRQGNGKPALPRPKRYAPHWGRHFTLWCRGVLPEEAHLDAYEDATRNGKRVYERLEKGGSPSVWGTAYYLIAKAHADRVGAFFDEVAEESGTPGCATRELAKWFHRRKLAVTKTGDAREPLELIIRAFNAWMVGRTHAFPKFRGFPFSRIRG
jgi:hypothetical protein